MNYSNTTISSRVQSGPHVVGLRTEIFADWRIFNITTKPFIDAAFPLLPLEGVEVHTAHSRLFLKGKLQPYLKTTLSLYLEGLLRKHKAGELQ